MIKNDKLVDRAVALLRKELSVDEIKALLGDDTVPDDIVYFYRQPQTGYTAVSLHEHGLAAEIDDAYNNGLDYELYEWNVNTGECGLVMGVYSNE